MRQRQAARRRFRRRPQRPDQRHDIGDPEAEARDLQGRAEFVARPEHHRQAEHRAVQHQPVHARPGQTVAQHRSQRDARGQGDHQELPGAERTLGDAELAQGGDRPPERGPDEQQRRQTESRAMPIVDQAQQVTADGEYRRAEPERVQQQLRLIHRRRRIEHVDHVGAGCQQLQHEAADPREQAVLPQADPGDARTFQRPDAGRRAGAEGQGHGQRGETERKRGIGFAQQALALALAQPPDEAGIDRGDADRAECEREPVVLQHARLQRERDQGRTEHQGAVHPRATVFGLLRHVQQADDDVEQEEQDQEGFDRGEQFRPVVSRAPGRADAEGETETDQVEQAPGLLPRDREHRGIEYGVIGEETDVVGAAGRDQHGREIAAEEAEHRQPHVPLQHRQQRRTGHQHDDQGEGEHRRQQAVQLVGREHRQQQHAERTALQAQPERGFLFALSPAERQAGQRGDGDDDQPRFDRESEIPLHRRIAQRCRDTGEQDQHADLHRHIAFGEPAFDLPEQILDPSFFHDRLGTTTRRNRRRRRGRQLRRDHGRGGGGFGGHRRLGQVGAFARGRRRRFANGGGRGRNRRRNRRRTGGRRRWRRRRGRWPGGRSQALAQGLQFAFLRRQALAQLVHSHQQENQQEADHRTEQVATFGQRGTEQGSDDSQYPVHAFPPDRICRSLPDARSGTQRVRDERPRSNRRRRAGR